jgi:hypothetical protein
MPKFSNKIRHVIEAPRRAPVPVVLTHVPLLLFWVAFPVRELFAGSVKLHGGYLVEVGADPVGFYLIAVLILGVAIFAAARICIAVDQLLAQEAKP